MKVHPPITHTGIQELERLLFESSKVGTREDLERSYGKEL